MNRDERRTDIARRLGLDLEALAADLDEDDDLDDVDLKETAGEEAVMRLYDELASESGREMDEHDRAITDTMGELLDWLESEDEDEGPKIDIPFAWRDKISPFQRKILTGSTFVGVPLFIGGLQMSIRGVAGGEILAGLGMFIAVQMFWGIGALFGKLEAREAKVLQTWGYRSSSGSFSPGPTSSMSSSPREPRWPWASFPEAKEPTRKGRSRSRSRITDHGSRITDHGSRITDHGSRPQPQSSTRPSSVSRRPSAVVRQP